MDIRNLVKVASVGANENTIITVLQGFPRVSFIHKVNIDPKGKISYGTVVRGGKESDRTLAQALVDQHRETYDKFINSFASIYFL